MPILNLFKNCTYYWGFTAYVAYHINHPLYTSPNMSQVYAALAVFVVSWKLFSWESNNSNDDFSLLKSATYPSISAWEASGLQVHQLERFQFLMRTLWQWSSTWFHALTTPTSSLPGSHSLSWPSACQLCFSLSLEGCRWRCGHSPSIETTRKSSKTTRRTAKPSFHSSSKRLNVGRLVHAFAV